MARTIADYKADYAKASASGDARGMKRANDGANRIRESTGVAKEIASVDIANTKAKSRTTPSNTVIPTSTRDTSKKDTSTRDTSTRDTSSIANTLASSTPTFKDTESSFYDKYAKQIAGISNTEKINGQPVDLSVAKAMFTANLNNKNGDYKGAGVAENWGEMLTDHKNLKDVATNEVMNSGRKTNNAQGQSMDISELLSRPTTGGSKTVGVPGPSVPDGTPVGGLPGNMDTTGLMALLNGTGSKTNAVNTEDEIYKLIQSLPSELLNYKSAKNMADEQLSATYDGAMDNAMKSIDRQSLQNGFFGQLPTVDYKSRNANEIEQQRASAVAQLANQLVSESKADVNNKITNLTGYNKNMSDAEYRAWEKNFKEKEYGDSRTDVNWEKIFKERGYTDSRSDVNWQKGVTTAQLTGVFNGSPTLALTELTHSMGMDNKQMAMAEAKMNNDITMSWENLKNDKVALGQAGARIGLQRQGQALDEKKYMSGVKEKAFDMTMTELERTGKVSYDDELGYLFDEGGSGQSAVTEADILTLMDSYTQVLLGLKVYEEEAPASGNTNYNGLYKAQ